MAEDSSYQNPGSANRELARIVRELAGVLPCGPEVDWSELRGRCREVLQTFIRDSPKSRYLTELLDGADYFVGGDEHHIIRVDSDPNRVYKFTHGDNFGCRSYFSAADPDLIGHFHGETNADPFFYLFRWMLLNTVSDYQTRFEGFVPAEKPNWLPRICISQPELGGQNPTPSEIRSALGVYGFVEVSENAFFDAETKILFTDAAPRNVRIIDGIPVPFDAIAQIPSGKILEWCLARCQK